VVMFFQRFPHFLRLDWLYAIIVLISVVIR
jgi:hypothetical protein